MKGERLFLGWKGTNGRRDKRRGNESGNVKNGVNVRVVIKKPRFYSHHLKQQCQENILNRGERFIGQNLRPKQPPKIYWRKDELLQSILRITDGNQNMINQTRVL